MHGSGAHCEHPLVTLHNEVENECEGFVTRWVVVAEVLKDGEERELHVLSGPRTGPQPWDVIGMLRVAESMAMDAD